MFFDLEKAYDTKLRYGILKDIHKLRLRDRLPTFIENFLADRAMQVWVGSSLSDYYDQEQGVPQGGVLSTTLSVSKFMILWNVKVILLIAHYMLMTSVSLIAQKAWGRLNVNCNKIWIRLKIGQQAMALSFPNQKLQCVHFCQLRKQHDDPVLHLYGSPIPVVEESKFLGILFDRKLSFIPHIKYLKAKC